MQQTKLQGGPTRHVNTRAGCWHLLCFSSPDVLPICLPWHLAAPAAGSYRAYSGPQGVKQSRNLTSTWCHAPRVLAAASTPTGARGAGRHAQPAGTATSLTPGKGSAWESPCALNFSKPKVLRYHLKRVKVEGEGILIRIAFVFERFL